MNSLATCICVCGLNLAGANAAIVYTEGMGFLTTSGFPGRGSEVQDMDFDGDGAIDLYFRISPFTSYQLIPFPDTDNRVLAVRAALPELQKYAVQVQPGEVIGTATDPEIWWGLADRVRPTDLGPYLWNGNGFPWGWPREEELFVGVQLLIDGQVHYGWIGVKTRELQGAHGYVTGWAYETDAERPIVAGVIPEPAVLVLGITSALAAVFRRNRPPPDPGNSKFSIS